MTQINWRKKYRDVKERYDQLYRIRHEAVKVDIKNLEDQIEEHKKAHFATIQEIEEENRFILETISRLEKVEEEITKIKPIVRDIKEKLRVHDTILQSVLRYKFLTVNCIGNTHYRISCLYNNSDVIFELYKESNVIMYHAIAIPNYTVFNRFKPERLQIPNLDQFCETLQNIVTQ